MTPEAPQPDQSPDQPALSNDTSELTELAKDKIFANQNTGADTVDTADKVAAAREIITSIPEELAPAPTPEIAPVLPTIAPMPGTIPASPEAAPAPPVAEPMPGTIPATPEAAPAPPMAEPMPVTPDSPVV